MNDNSMCYKFYACIVCYLMVLDESVLYLLSPEHICTHIINTNDDKNMYNIQMFFVY